MALTIVEISRARLLHNVSQFTRHYAPGKELFAVLKSNAYGSGMVAVAKILEPTGVSYAVVSIEEALQLRESGIRGKILVLGNIDYEDSPLLKEACRCFIELSVYSISGLRAIDLNAAQTSVPARVHIKVDTGMTRFGVHWSSAVQFIEEAMELRNLQVEGIYSHFAAADELGAMTSLQIKRFANVLEDSAAQKINIPCTHIANTAGAIAHTIDIGNAVRIGLGMYGFYPSLWVREQAAKRYPTIALQPVLQWKTRIVQIQERDAGEAVSYGCVHHTTKPSVFAVLPVGYWDGFDRGLSNCGEVLIDGVRCPVRGRVCMNQIIVEVTALPNVFVGQEVVLIGKSGDDEITAEELAKKLDTVAYEIVTRINPIIPRVYAE